MDFKNLVTLFVVSFCIVLPLCSAIPLADKTNSDKVLQRYKRLINGTEVQPHSWPWHVSLEVVEGGLRCGGVLINSDWVLSAAHCFGLLNNTGRPECWRAVVGVHNRSAAEPSREIRSIESIHSHSSWDVLYSDHDIALIKLANPVQLTSEVQVAPLSSPDSSESELSNCILIGIRHRLHNKTAVDSILEQIEVPVLSKSQCLKYDLRITDRVLCAGSRTLPVESEWGDSGNPLICKKDGKYVVAGILSWGRTEDPRISIYTKVSKYRDWIRKVISHDIGTPKIKHSRKCVNLRY